MIKNKHRQFFKGIVESASKMSHDKKLQVGALLVKNGRIVTTGYNGQPAGIEIPKIEENGHDITTIHAEMNCLLFAARNGISTEDCEIVVSHYPCLHCTKHLIQAGIKRIYYIEGYKNDDNIFADFIKIERLIE